LEPFVQHLETKEVDWRQFQRCFLHLATIMQSACGPFQVNAIH